jgi:branched-subunit amino acid ABC-type transport system permease component
MLLDILDIVTTVALLYVVAFGLLVVFGVMSVINLAHGAFIVLGAYSGLVVTALHLNPWWSFVFAIAAGLLFGAVIELLVVRRLYDRPLDTILATWGLSIIIIQLITLCFGRAAQFVSMPIHGFTEFGGMRYSTYRLVIVAIALTLWCSFGAFTRFTEYGLVARAVIMNEGLAAALGINTQRVRLVTFSVGSAMAAFAGAALAPMSSIDPNLGLPFVIPAFMIVFVAGPSLTGLAFSAAVLGTCQTLVSIYGNQVVGSLVIVVVAVLLVRLFPRGITPTTIRETIVLRGKWR